MQINWQWYSFTELSGIQMHALLELRQRVFVVEQACAYPDADGHDRESLHLLGYDDHKKLVACARLNPPGDRFSEPSIGRVVVAQACREKGLGRKLMLESIRKSQQLYPAQAIRISAQVQLQAFYRSLGFIACGQPYDEDGIDHIDMLLSA